MIDGFLHHCHAPQVVCEQLGRAVCEEQIRVDMMERKAVVSELFSSVCVEIRDEVGFSLLFLNKHFCVVLEPVEKGVFAPQVNIPLGSLGQPVLMGVALNHTSAGRPSAEFYVRYSLTYEVDLLSARTVLRR